MEKLENIWLWIQKVNLLRWIFFLPIGFISYFSFYFIKFAWHSSENHVYIMMFIIDFFGVFIGVYLATVIAPKFNLLLARVSVVISIGIIFLTAVSSFISFGKIAMVDILPPILNLCACGIVFLSILHNINLFEELIIDADTVK